MDIKLFDSELKVMEVLWEEGDSTAKHIAAVLQERVGWNVNTTYTLIKRCIQKGAIARSEPHFMCHGLVTREEVQAAATDELIDKIYGGSADLLFASLISRNKLSKKQVEELKKLIREME
jgi:predicted transcriptional regulator